MTPKKKFIFIILSLMMLAWVFLLLSQKLNHAEIEQKTYRYLEKVSGKYQGNITFKSGRLEFFPIPRLVIDQVYFIFPEKSQGSIRRVEAYPRFLPLLRGTVKFSSIKISSPEIKIVLSYEDSFQIPAVSVLKEQLDRGFAAIKKDVSDISVQIRHGKISVDSGSDGSADFFELNGAIKLVSSRIQVLMDCRSSLWEKARIDFRLFPKDYEAAGSLSIERLNIFDFRWNLFQNLNETISEIRAESMNLSFDTRQFAEIKGNLNGHDSSIIINLKDQEPVNLRSSAYEAGFSADSSGTLIRVSRLLLTEPEVALSGILVSDKLKPSISLEIAGQNADVQSIRKTALPLLGQFKTTRVLFDYLREGEIPQVIFLGKAPSWKDFKIPGNIALNGELKQGRVFIPAGALDLKEVSGKVRVSDGMLIGRNLKARLENSEGTDCKFEIGLHGKEAPFHLEVGIDADLSQLPPILMRLIKNDQFLKEMMLVENLTGQASGKLVLGNIKNAVRPTVSVNRFAFSGNYLRTPLIISMSGGEVTYDNKQIEIMGAKGFWGDSRFDGVEASFDWRDRPLFAWNFDNASVIPEQIYTWLQSMEGFNAFYNLPVKPEGIIDLYAVEIKGPLFNPSAWIYDASGKIHGMKISDSRFFPSEADLEGDFRAGNEKIDFSDMRFHFSDSLLTGSGRLNGSLNRIYSGQVVLEGVVGPAAFPWYAQKANLPFSLRQGISLSLSDTDIRWDEKSLKNFSASIGFKDGPNINLKGERSEKGLMIDSLVIADKISDAALKLFQTDRNLDLSYAGSLDMSTVKKVVDFDGVVSGSFEGEFNALLLMDQWKESKFQGHLTGKGISFAQDMKIPFAIDRFSAATDYQHLIINSDLVFNEESNLNVAGFAFQQESEIVFDLGVDSDTINVNHFISWIKQIRSRTKTQEPGLLYRFPLRGNIRATSSLVQFDRFQWSGVNADLLVEPEGVRIDIEEGSLCGINTAGHLLLGTDFLQIDFKPHAEGCRLESTLSCLVGLKDLIQGDFKLNGEIIAGGKSVHCFLL
jgi:hypothetical protein